MTGTFSIAVAAASYLLYYGVTQDKTLQSKVLGQNPQVRDWIRNIVYYQRGSGVLLLGIVPAVAVAICCPELFGMIGIAPAKIAEYWPWFAGGMALMYGLSWFGARQPDTLARYPEMRIAEWTAKTFAASAGAWMAYLAAYEFLFRGVLLFGCYEAFGKWPAVAISVALYTYAHLWKGWRETLGSAVFGILAALATLHTGTILLPFLAHCVTSIHTEYLCIRYRQDMKFV